MQITHWKEMVNPRSYITLLLALTICINLTCFTSAFAAEDLSFAWSPNPPEDNIVGYRLYYGIESRYDANGNPKADFTYDHYIDFNESVICSGTNYETCSYLGPADFSCDNTSDPIVCTIAEPSGINYYTLKAYNDYEISGFSAEIRYPDGNPTNFVSTINLLLLNSE